MYLCGVPVQYCTATGTVPVPFNDTTGKKDTGGTGTHTVPVGERCGTLYRPVPRSAVPFARARAHADTRYNTHTHTNAQSKAEDAHSGCASTPRPAAAASPPRPSWKLTHRPWIPCIFP